MAAGAKVFIGRSLIPRAKIFRPVNCLNSRTTGSRVAVIVAVVLVVVYLLFMSNGPLRRVTSDPVINRVRSPLGNAGG